MERSRNIALCVPAWAEAWAPWIWLQQYFLSPADHLFVVHLPRSDEKREERWKVGGPLVADLETALGHQRHSVTTLTGSLQSSIRDFVTQHRIDVVVMGERWPQHMFQINSVTDWVKHSIRSPFIIVQARAVRNPRMRIHSMSGESPAGVLATSPQRPPSPLAGPGPPPRKILIAYTSFPTGRGLIVVAKQVALAPGDTVYMAHVYPQAAQAVVRDAKKLMRAVTLQRPESPEVTEENSIDFGAKELAGAVENVHLGVVLKGDVRSAMCAFCEAEGIDLLIIGTRSTNYIKKTLSGGSVSGYLIDHAPCPCLVIPYKAMGLAPEGGASTDEELDHGLSSPSDLPTVDALMAQLAEKERTIASLQAELQALKLKKDMAGSL